MRTRLSSKGWRLASAPPACGMCSKQCNTVGSVEHDNAGGVDVHQDHVTGRRRRVGSGTFCHGGYRPGMTDDIFCPNLIG